MCCFRYGDELLVTVSYAHSVVGLGYKRDIRGSIIEYKDSHPNCKIFIKIRNTDHSCCARAVVTAKAKADKDPQWNSIRVGDQSGCHLQRNRAFELMKAAEVSPDQPCGIPEIRKFQSVLGPEYQIKVSTLHVKHRVLHKFKCCIYRFGTIFGT